jgi:hypothetical protein
MRLRLKQPLTLIINHGSEDGLKIAHEPILDMHLYGETEEELIQAAKDELLFLWDTYGQADDAILTKDAQELKRRVLALLEKL